jgi:Sulfotransferase family
MPIIIGAPRSGTTLLRFMLDSHPELAIPPETGFLKFGRNFRGRGDKLRERFFRAIVDYDDPFPSWADFEITAESFWVALTEINPFTISDGYRCFYRLYAARHGKARWGDKTPLYCLSMKVIRHALPEARFIHIIRDGRDAALSLREMWFSPGWKMETQGAYWRKFVLAARRAGLGHADYVEVRYEDLILAPEETLKHVCRHIGLDYDAAMLDYYTRTPKRLEEHKGRFGPNGSARVTQDQRLRQQAETLNPPNAARVFAWKRSMSAEDRRAFQLVAGDLLKEFGYEL